MPINYAFHSIREKVSDSTFKMRKRTFFHALMKFKFKHSLIAIAISWLLIPVLAADVIWQKTYAVNDVVKISSLLGKNMSILKATVIVAPGHLEHSLATNDVTLSQREDILKEVGCTYVAQDKYLIESLINILDNANAKVKDANDLFLIPVYQKISLYLADGSEEKLIFAPGPPDGPANGVIVNAEHKQMVLVSVIPVTEKLYAWAASVGPNSNKQDPINAVVMNCEKNVR